MTGRLWEINKNKVSFLFIHVTSGNVSRRGREKKKWEGTGMDFASLTKTAAISTKTATISTKTAAS